MDALEALTLVTEALLLSAIGADIGLAIRVRRAIRRVPEAFVAARLFTLLTSWWPLWGWFTLAMVFFTLGFLGHSLLGFVVPGAEGERIHEAMEALLGGIGFACFAVWLATVDAQLRAVQSPLLSPDRAAKARL